MNSKPTVAVLMCLYGGDRLDWFKVAMESVSSQDYEGDIRVYLGIDGVLSEEMEAYLKHGRAVYYKTVRNKVNIGLSKTLNRLINVLENEEYIFRFDADDICLPYRFSSQIEFLQKHQDIDVVGGAIWEYEEGAPVVFKKNYPRGNEEIRHYIVRANPIAHSTVCFRRRFFSLITAYPDKYRYNQDLALWVEGLRKGVKMANLDLPLVCLRTSNEFFIRRGVERAFSELFYYLSAIRYLHGWNWRVIVPLMRFFSRLLPPFGIRMIYKSRIRDWVCSLGK